jgi:hypothetical protein
MSRFIFLIAALVLAGCNPTWPVDELVRGHAEVDRLLDAKDPQGARSVLENMLASPALEKMGAEEKRIVIHDLSSRLAETQLLLGDAAGALAAVDRALAFGSKTDVFTANLHVAAGRALETLGRSSEAAERYHHALRINEALLEKELDE